MLFGLLRALPQPDRAAPVRAFQVARRLPKAAFQRLLGGVEFAARLVRERAGGAFDPEVAACLAGAAGEILALDEHESAWEERLACEPDPQLMLAVDGSTARSPRWAASRT